MRKPAKMQLVAYNLSPLVLAVGASINSMSMGVPRVSRLHVLTSVVSTKLVSGAGSLVGGRNQMSLARNHVIIRNDGIVSLGSA